VTRRLPYELIFALAAVVLIAGWYAWLARSGVPRPAGLVGHGMGVAGFLLMLCTETLYPLRKHWRGFNFGRMSVWLQWHVFTGIVGPCLVVLHSGWKFHGLAGLLTLLTVVMVCSGFVGRYIYTAVPRTLDGVEAEASELETRIDRADGELKTLGYSSGTAALAQAYEAPPYGWLAVLARPWLRWRQRRRVRRALRQLRGADRARVSRLARLLVERYGLQLQIQSLAAVRRLLALWHALHVPLGGVTFTLAFLHIGGALYYATLPK
jgi:hypothetical protein